MKKIVCALFSLLLFCIICVGTVSANVYIKGDVNTDNVLDITDIAIMRAYIIGNKALSDKLVNSGDIDSSGDIDIIDVAYCRAVIIGTAKAVYFESNDVVEPEPVQPEMPDVPSDVRAVWFSFLEFSDYLKGKGEQEFTSEFNKIVANCKSIGINTMFVHVRSHGDAFYKSDLFPSSEYLSGTLDVSPNFDAFGIITKICRENGISVHAWINPYRLCTESQMENLDDKYLIKKWYNEKSDRLFLYNGRYYLNPAGEGVENLVISGAKELLKYDIDGIQIDDYFYVTTDSAIDNKQFSASAYSTRTQFRLDIVTKMVKRLNSLTKSADKPILFGVSPQGYIDNNYDTVYADVKLWASSTQYADYIAPQIYFGFKNSTVPFEKCLNDWQDLTEDSDVRLICGLAAYKIGAEDTYAYDGRYEWQTDKQILSRQIQAVNKNPAFSGYIYFRYGSLFTPQSSVASQIKDEISAIRAIIK